VHLQQQVLALVERQGLEQEQLALQLVQQQLVALGELQLVRQVRKLLRHQLPLNVRQLEQLNRQVHRLKELFLQQVKEFRYQLCQLKLQEELHQLRLNLRRPLTSA
jgi:hypothetical protein